MVICKICGKKFNSIHSNPKYCSEQCRVLADRKYCKKYRELHKKEISLRRKTNRPYINAYHKKYYHSHPGYRLAHNMRRRIQLTLKGKRKIAHTEEMLGCSWKEFLQHIEKQWVRGMSWKNYGRLSGYKKFWEMDHIKPCCSFTFKKPIDQLNCFGYKNIQPLWWIDNIKKGKKYE
jgi:hypothetical protein